jgi:hypothetical protein
MCSPPCAQPAGARCFASAGRARRHATLCSPAGAHQQMPLLRNRLKGSAPHDAVIISTGRTSRCSRAGAHCFAIARQARSYTTLCSPGCPLMHSCRQALGATRRGLTSMRSPACAHQQMPAASRLLGRARCYTTRYSPGCPLVHSCRQGSVSHDAVLTRMSTGALLSAGLGATRRGTHQDAH